MQLQPLASRLWIVDTFVCCVHFGYSGADLINRNMFNRLQQQKELEQQIVANIIKKMDRIKERHLRFQPPGYKEPTDHYEGWWNYKSSSLAV